LKGRSTVSVAKLCRADRLTRQHRKKKLKHWIKLDVGGERKQGREKTSGDGTRSYFDRAGEKSERMSESNRIRPEEKKFENRKKF